jgi:hypothetical protein
MKSTKQAVFAIAALAAVGLLGFVVFGQSDATPDPGPSADVPFGAYAPEQPIDYSHKLHAGDLQIPCQFCHTYARRSKSAGIPSLEQCMACHNVIAPTKERIQQITKAYDSQEPIEWVKVHDLPDFVYFSHKQHVAAGFECQECHGPVEEMEVLYRHAPLTMGWCVECHRDNMDKGAQVDCLICHK